MSARDYKGPGGVFNGQPQGIVSFPKEVRRLTPTECCRLQGFPDDWNDWLSDSQRYKQMGNAVTVPVAQWIGEQIVQAHKSPIRILGEVNV